MTEIQLNEDAVTEMATRLLPVVRDHLSTKPYGRNRVFESVNALGICISVVLAGIPENDRKDIRTFLSNVIDGQVAELENILR